MLAGETANADVRAQAHHFPIITAARMRFAQADNITQR